MLRKRTSPAVAVLLFSCSSAFLHGQTAPTRGELDQALATIREYALNYAKSLPDYTCTRVTQEKDLLGWTLGAKLIIEQEETPVQAFNRGTFTPGKRLVEEELTVSGQREDYRVLKLDGTYLGPGPRLRAVELNQGFLGTIPARAFGSALDSIFAPETGTTFQWIRFAKVRGRRVLVFSFVVPHPHGARIYDAAVGREDVVSYKGLVFADAVSKAVLRVELHSTDFPTDSEALESGSLTGIDLTLDFKAVQIAGRDFVMPYGFDVQRHRHAPGSIEKLRAMAHVEELRIQGEYKDFHSFSAQSAVSFGGADSSPEGTAHSSITFGGIVSPAIAAPSGQVP